jgi:hypothetical protein
VYLTATAVHAPAADKGPSRANKAAANVIVRVRILTQHNFESDQVSLVLHVRGSVQNQSLHVQDSNTSDS